jgi:hypothetical protein
MIYRLWNRRKREPEPDLPLVGSRDRQFRGLFAGVPLIIVLVVVTIFALLVFLNSRFMARVAECRTGYNSYPNMQVIDEQEPYFLQPFGRLMTELYSPDPPEEVEAWLNRARAAIMREAVASGDFSDIPGQWWSIEPAANGGSQIVLYCP